LGCGPGRATAIATTELADRFSTFQLVDLSSQMLAASRKRFSNYLQLNYLQDDSVHQLEQTANIYDLVFSLWSLSHSVHQILSARGLQEGTDYVESVLRKFFTTNLAPGARFFLIHFDSLSDEQRILMRQWKKVFPIFSDLDHQSPSEQLVNSLLNKLQSEGVIDFQRTHLVGEKIVYKDMNEALEIFINFHMESYFNDSDLLAGVIAELEAYFQGYLTPSGTIEIRPGSFIYTVKRLA
jgi:SAM-dependent methyltransferase